MSDALKHKFTSPKADVGDASLVRASNWNDEHVFAGGAADDDILVWAGAQSDKVTWKSIVSLLGKILTAKGDLIVRDASGAIRLQVGPDGAFLVADSTEPGGVKWTSIGIPAGVPTGACLPYPTSAAPSGYLSANGQSVARATYPDLFALIGTTYGSVDGDSFNVPDYRSRVPLGYGAAAPTWVATITNINTGTDVITIDAASTTFQTGAPVVYSQAGGSDAAPLVNTNTYYLIKVTATTYKLATSRANAVAGVAINMTGTGSGTQRLTYTFQLHDTVGARGGEEEHTLTKDEMPVHDHPTSTPVYSGTPSSGTVRISGFQDDGSGINVGSTPSVDVQDAGGSVAHPQLPPYIVVHWIIKT